MYESARQCMIVKEKSAGQCRAGHDSKEKCKKVHGTVKDSAGQCTCFSAEPICRTIHDSKMHKMPKR